MYLFINTNQRVIADNEDETLAFLPEQDTVNTRLFPYIESELETLEQDRITELQKAEFDEKVRKLNAAFQQYGGYLNKNHARIMVQKTVECGGDYRVLGAIAGKESGFGRINYKLYNPFGYLDGVQYASQEQALEILTCKIANRYLVPCNNDLHCIATSGYAGEDTDIPNWIGSLNTLIQLIESK